MATGAQAAKLEQKALAAGSKSEGMRMLFENGYTVAQVKEIFGVPYGFAYGVADRGGFLADARTPRAPKAEAKPAKATKAAKAEAPAKAPRAAKAPAKAAAPARRTRATAKA